jgi:hypothetical protein
MVDVVAEGEWVGMLQYVFGINATTILCIDDAIVIPSKKVGVLIVDLGIALHVADVMRKVYNARIKAKNLTASYTAFQKATKPCIWVGNRRSSFAQNKTESIPNGSQQLFLRRGDRW